MIENKEVGRFAHENNIQIGVGRIIWSQGSQPHILKIDEKGKAYAEEGPRIEAGWALPGGTRTNDKAQAEEAAKIIDQMAKRL